MKWIIILLIAGVGVWAYLNADFTNFKTNAENTFKQEKTLKITCINVKNPLQCERFSGNIFQHYARRPDLTPCGPRAGYGI